MWAKIKSVLKKPVVLGLSVGFMLVVAFILLRKRSAPQQLISATKGLVDKADAIIPTI